MKVFHTIANIFHIWLSRRRNTGIALVKSGVLIILSAFGLPALYFSFKGADGGEVELHTSDSVIGELSFYTFILGAILILSGAYLVFYEKIKGEGAPNNRAKSIDLRSLKSAHAPQLCDSFPILIDQAGLYDSLYMEDFIYDAHGHKEPSCFLPITAKILTEFSTGFLKTTRKKEVLKPLSLGAIAHVPYCFSLGFLISNRSIVHYYCWKRDQHDAKKTKWIDCREKIDLGQDASFNTIINNNLKDIDVKKIGISIEISIKSDEKLFMEHNNLDACCKVAVDNQFIGNMFSDVEQIRVIGQIIDYFNNKLSKRFPNLTELHITISAQASFVMRLGAELNQNHMPEIKIYHFEKGYYPWYLVLNNGADKVGWGQVSNYT